MTTVAIFLLFAGTLTPEVNEAHYLTKAYHFWNPSFGTRDLFLNSGDAHWFFFSTVGGLTRLFDFPVAAWIGRLLGWSIVSLGWSLLVRTVWRNSFAGTLTAPLWLAAMHYGHLSGEWIVGGCEAKVFAYGLVFIGLSFVLQGDWKSGWVWMGAGAAFHVLTGGWIILASLVAFPFCRHWSPLRIDPDARTASAPNGSLRSAVVEQLPWLVLGAVLSLPGLIPALLLNRGIDAVTAEKGAMIYVFQRLPHHLVPQQFGSTRWFAHISLLVLTVALGWLYFQAKRAFDATIQSNRANGFNNSIDRTKASDEPLPFKQTPAPLAISTMLVIAMMVGLFAVIGLLIDVGLSSWATNWSASLLRYYWFRWNDVVWPILLVFFALAFVQIVMSKFRETTRAVADRSSNSVGVVWKAFCLAELVLLIVPGSYLIATKWAANDRERYSPSDRASLAVRSETYANQLKILNDWREACSWVRTNSAEDSLWLTPRYQQTFKWYARRSEVACWKDSPQDALGLIEWEKRLLDIFRVGPDGYGRPWTNEELFEFRKTYRCEYVLVDRRIQTKPPLMPLLFSNAHYAIFQFADAVDPNQVKQEEQNNIPTVQ